MIELAGTGWIINNSYGCLNGRVKTAYKDIQELYSQLIEQSFIPGPIRNFNRFDENSKLTLCAAALALADANFPAMPEDFGIIGNDPEGSFKSNMLYYKDFYDNGRKFGRGNLFIYTLATSPLAETAIFFGLKGPLLQVMFNERKTSNLLKMGRDIIGRGEANAMLIVDSDQTGITCFLLAKSEIILR